PVSGLTQVPLLQRLRFERELQALPERKVVLRAAVLEHHQLDLLPFDALCHGFSLRETRKARSAPLGELPGPISHRQPAGCSSKPGTPPGRYPVTVPKTWTASSVTGSAAWWGSRSRRFRSAA